MRRAAELAAIVLVTCAAIGPLQADQAQGELHVRIAIADAAGQPVPIARHTLLISDQPPSAPPRRLSTAADGTASLTLPAGQYLVESDRPVVFEGQAYAWAEAVDVPAGGRASLELSAVNARSRSPAAPASPASDGSAPDVDPEDLLIRWAPNVVAIWTPTSYATGLVVDRRGIVATSRRAVGAATTVEVQVSASVKVAGQVLPAESVQELALVRVAPSILPSSVGAPAPCAESAKPPAFAIDRKIIAIGAPIRRPPEIVSGAIRSAGSGTVVADLRLAPATDGGPVFTDDGQLVGLSAAMDASDARLADAVRIVSLDRLCAAVRGVESRMAETAPDDTRLPVERVQPFPAEALAALASKRAGRIPPTAQSSGFDLAFITPVDLYAAARDAAATRRMDFSNWADYVADMPAVLLVRATPRQVESFWVTLARGAAFTQGARLPRITHYKAGFDRLRAFCGSAEVTPIHAFKIELRLSETEGTWEGLTVFDPGALSPSCGRVRFELYSDETPDRPDTVVIEPGVIQRVWDDFKNLNGVGMN